MIKNNTIYLAYIALSFSNGTSYHKLIKVAKNVLKIGYSSN